MTSCPECCSVDIVYDHATGDSICRGCAVVVAACHMEQTPIWEVANASTVPTQKVALSSSAAEVNRTLIRHNRQMHSDPDKRARQPYLVAIQRICGYLLKAQCVSDTAEMWFNKIMEEGRRVRGQNRWGVVGACIYYAAMINRSYSEAKLIVSQANYLGFTMSEQVVNKMCKIMAQKHGELAKVMVPSASDLIGQYMTLLKVPAQKREALAMCRKVAETIGKQQGRTPPTIAAAIIHCVLKKRFNTDIKNQIAKSCWISPNTLEKSSLTIMSHC